MNQEPALVKVSTKRLVAPVSLLVVHGQCTTMVANSRGRRRSVNFAWQRKTKRLRLVIGHVNDLLDLLVYNLIKQRIFPSFLFLQLGGRKVTVPG